MFCTFVCKSFCWVLNCSPPCLRPVNNLDPLHVSDFPTVIDSRGVTFPSLSAWVPPDSQLLLCVSIHSVSACYNTVVSHNIDSTTSTTESTEAVLFRVEKQPRDHNSITESKPINYWMRWNNFIEWGNNIKQKVKRYKDLVERQVRKKLQKKLTKLKRSKIRQRFKKEMYLKMELWFKNIAFIFAYL